MTLATNPCRLSFLGKEIVISRFNYLKKIKQNNLPKIQFAQQKWLANNPEHKQVDDAYRVANTVLRQGHLLPLA